MKCLVKISFFTLLGLGLIACAKKAPIGNNLDSASPVAASTQPLAENTFGFESNAQLTQDELLSIKTYYFKFDSTELLGVNLQAVQAQGQCLSSNPKHRVLLKGYTDIQGSREYNIGLGYRRAQSVAAEMKAQGVHPDQIEIVSYGPLFPADSSNSKEAYQKNRRVELAPCQGQSCASVYGGGALKGKVK